ncbi:MAG TPA: chromosomal replication initiator protein DnaA [Solirubrobacteraceae bacterium]
MPTDPNDPRWLRVRSELRRAVSDSTWDLWLAPLTFEGADGTVLTIAAPVETRAWVADRFGRLLQACAAAVLGPEIDVEVIPAGDDERPQAPDLPAAPRSGKRRTPRLPATPERIAEDSARDTPRPTERLNPRLTFDQFVIGDSNRLAHAAALAVAEMPGLAYNPLYICGPPGLGKTHLLHSIANYIRAYGGGATVRYTTAEAFTNRFIGSIQSSGAAAEAFKEAHRGVDVLLVDDVQFLASKTKTVEEFFHTFNALHAGGAQIVLTSDRLPRDIDALEDRLRERFEAGLVTDVRPPDYETRLTILRKRIQQDGVPDADPRALEIIAERVDQNIRALEGALIRVVAFGSLTHQPVTAELAAEVLGGLYPELQQAEPTRRTIREIQELTCEAFGVSLDDLLSTSRTARITGARQVAMYLARELTEETLPAIGRAFGNRNHTTVMHAVKRTTERMAGDADAFAAVDRITRMVRGERGDRPA